MWWQRGLRHFAPPKPWSSDRAGRWEPLGKTRRDIGAAEIITNTILGVLVIIVVSWAPRPYFNYSGLYIKSPCLFSGYRLHGARIVA